MKRLFITLIVLSASVKAFSQSAATTILANITFNKTPCADFDKLRNAAAFLVHDSTHTKSNMADLSAWINAGEKYMARYKYDSTLVPLPGKHFKNSEVEIYSNDSMAYGTQVCFYLLLYSETIHSMRASFKFDKKDYNGAIDDWVNCLNYYALTSEGAGPINFDIGLCYLNLNDTNTACQYMSKAGEQGIEKAYDFIRTYCNSPTR